MKFYIAAIAALVLVGQAVATQQLNPGYFLYNNLTVNSGEFMVVGINTSSPIDLMVIHSYDFGTFLNGGKVNAVYNSSASTGVYRLSLGPGTYTVISEAKTPTELDSGAIVVPDGKGTMAYANGTYNYSFSIGNYSNVYVTLLSSSDYLANPLVFSLAGVSTRVNANTNLDIVNTTLNKGSHTISISSAGRSSIFIYVNTTPTLINPLSYVAGGSNYSAGIASYGLYNISGRIYPYQVSTGEVIGVANITSLAAYNAGASGNNSKHGASLQLNVALNTHVNGKERVLWLQDVVDFNTSSMQYYLIDNVWNSTSPTAKFSSGALVGNGNLSGCTSCSSPNFYAFSYPSYYLNYSFPFRIKLVVMENQTSEGTVASFGYQILKNGSAGIKPLIFFDKVLVPGSSNSTLLTTPYYMTPGDGSNIGNYYDSELVFGGEANGANSYFNSMNSSLWIYYNDNGTIRPFPSVYTFGLSTAESASNLAVKGWKGGAIATTGKPDFSTDIFATNALEGIAAYISNTSKYSSPTTVPTTVTTVYYDTVSQSEIVTLEMLAAAAIVIIVVIGLALLRRR